MKYEKNERINTLKTDDGIDFILNEGESVLWQGKPNKKAYVLNKVLHMLPFAIIWLAFDLFFIIMLFKFNLPTGAKVGVFAFICLHLLPFWIWLFNVLFASRRHKNTRYVLTNQRILIRTGLIGIDFQSISYKDVDRVSLKVGIVDKILKVGDLYFISSLRGQNAFFDVDSPYEVYKIVQKIVNDIQTDIHFPNAYRPNVNPGYNTKINNQK